RQLPVTHLHDLTAVRRGQLLAVVEKRLIGVIPDARKKDSQSPFSFLKVQSQILLVRRRKIPGVLHIDIAHNSSSKIALDKAGPAPTVSKSRTPLPPSRHRINTPAAAHRN